MSHGSRHAVARVLSELHWWEAVLVMTAAGTVLYLCAWALTTPRLTGGKRYMAAGGLFFAVLLGVAAFVLFVAEEF